MKFVENERTGKESKKFKRIVDGENDINII